MSENIELKIVIDGKEAKANLDSAQAGINNLSNAAKNTQNSLNGMKVGSGNAAMAVMSLSQAMGDAGGFAYSFRQGMMGVGNNMQMVVQSVMQLKAETGGTKTAMAALGSAFMGPMGLMVGINAAITFLPMLIDYLGQSGQKAVESSDGLKKYNDQLKDMGAKDLGKELTQREMIVKALEDALEANKEIEVTEYSASTRIKDPALDAALNERLSINKQLLKVAKDEKLEKDALLKYQKELNQEMTIKLPKGEKVTTKEDDEKEKQAFQKRVKDNEEREQKLRELSTMTAEYRVAVMKDGFDKELAAIDLRYAKELEKAKGNAELIGMIEKKKADERADVLEKESKKQLTQEKNLVNALDKVGKERVRDGKTLSAEMIKNIKGVSDEQIDAINKGIEASNNDLAVEEAAKNAKIQYNADVMASAMAGYDAQKSIGENLKKTIGDELTAYIAKAVIASVSETIATVPFPFNIALAAAAGVATKAAMTGLRSELGFARGGYVTGPGTSTSDSIPAYLSNGEYVVNALSTAMYYPALEAINARSTAMYYPALRAMNEGRVAYRDTGRGSNLDKKIDGLINAINNIRFESTVNSEGLRLAVVRADLRRRMNQVR